MCMPQPPAETRAGNMKGSVGHFAVLALLRDLENCAQGDTCRCGGMEASWYHGGRAMRWDAVSGLGGHGVKWVEAGRVWGTG